MAKPAFDKVQICFTISKEIADELAVMADREDRSVASLVRKFVTTDL